jgi:hypothetical protein
MKFIHLSFVLASVQTLQVAGDIHDHFVSRCPERFTLFEHADHDVCLHVSSDLLTMSDAQQYCHELGGSLPVITTEVCIAQVSSAVASNSAAWISNKSTFAESQLALVPSSPADEEAFTYGTDAISALDFSVAPCVAFESGTWQSEPCSNRHHAVCSAEPAQPQGKIFQHLSNRVVQLQFNK